MPAIPAVVTAATTIGGAALSSRAQDKATRAANRALDAQRPVDIPATLAQAREADLAKIRDTFAAEDPTMAGLRRSTDEQLLSNVFGDQNTLNANQILSNLFSENVQLDPRDSAFQDRLKSEAQRQLDLGGQFSPEQQAELVRAGLEGASAAGFGAGSAAGRQSIGKLLASEQENLRRSRSDLAKDLFGFATDLQSTRNQNLLGIQGATTQAGLAEQGRLLGLANLVDARLTPVGLSGSDVANLAIGNTQQQNQLAAERARVAGEAAAGRADIANNLIGGLAPVVGQGISALTTRKPKVTIGPLIYN